MELHYIPLVVVLNGRTLLKKCVSNKGYFSVIRKMDLQSIGKEDWETVANVDNAYADYRIS